MSGFGAMNGMNQMLRNNAKLLRKRKPLEGRISLMSTNFPLVFRSYNKEYAIILRKRLKNQKIIRFYKSWFSFIITSIILSVIIYSLPIIW